MMTLDDNHRLTSDEYQYIVQKKVIVEDKKSKNFGKEVWRNKAYFPKIENVLRYMIDKKIKKNMDDVGKIISAVYDMESKFERLLQEKKR